MSLYMTYQFNIIVVACYKTLRSCFTSLTSNFAYSCFYFKQAVYLLITYTHYNHITNFKPGDLEKTSFRSIKPGIQKKGASTSRSNASAQNIYEDDVVVGNDLFGGIEDTDELQVFDCTSQDNTDTETEKSNIDDPTDVDVELLVNVVTKKTGDSQRPDVTGTTVVNYTAKKKQHLKENDGTSKQQLERERETKRR
ncbi:unnamed protein product [Brassica rapa]|uniref:Uncharacterized protein n=2 Tax=Brassica TaxID=3705 RepID=A0A8D9HUI4_BRACM|nr:unnamed protein product [Brassica napus]CAG7906135.1 unnamed protein product [Brassica rapa]